MPNTSATGGYLSPTVPSPPLEDADLDAVFQKAIAGITGLAGQYVRPRWQPTIPKQPEPSTDWCALGVTLQTPDAGPAIWHSASGQGSDSYTRHEDIEVLATFYGPLSQRYAATLRDGLAIPQNVEEIKKAGVSFIDAGEIRAAPELVNQQWVRRYDIALRFRRAVTRTYGVLNVLSSEIQLVDDSGHVNESITVP